MLLLIVDAPNAIINKALPHASEENRRVINGTLLFKGTSSSDVLMLNIAECRLSTRMNGMFPWPVYRLLNPEWDKTYKMY